MLEKLYKSTLMIAEFLKDYFSILLFLIIAFVLSLGFIVLLTGAGLTLFLGDSTNVEMENGVIFMSVR